MAEADEYEPKAVLDRGDEVGRYLILRVLGSGGTGIVYLADDPKLHRKVAVKLVRPDRVLAIGSRARGRIMREAQALAKLGHPNIVRVFDVGEYGEGVFIAMEYVEGQTLAAAIEDGQRSADEMVALFIQIASGLEAAHAAGLVHRDLKPLNVLIDEAGTPKVLDFGQALPDRAEGAPEGTPGFMAPEQYRGEVVGRQADIFAFCASLYEGLSGRRAFPGNAHVAYELALEGSLDFSPIPSAYHELIRTGLAFEPEQRTLGMGEIRHELQRILSRPRRRRRNVAIAAALMAGSVLGVSAAGLLDSDQCRKVTDETYLAPRKINEIRRGFVSIGAGSARFNRVQGRLRGYAQDLRDAEIRRCEASVEGAASGSDLDDIGVCLDFADQDFQAVVSALSGGSREALNSADRLLDALTDPQSCFTPEARVRQPSLPPGGAAREQVLSQYARIAGAAAQRASGRLDEAGSELDELETNLGATPDPGVRARLTYERGLLADDQRQPATAKDLLSSAVEMAAAADDDFLMVQAMVGVARVQSTGLHLPAQAQATLDLSASLARALGNPPELEHPIRFAQARSTRELQDHYTGCRELTDLADEPELELDRVELLLQLTDCPRTARDGVKRLTAERDRLFEERGEDDPFAAELNLGLAKLTSRPEDTPRAAGLIHDASKVLIKTHGTRSSSVAEAWQRAGLLALRVHDMDAAERYLRHARMLFASQVPVDRYELGRVSSNYGVLLSRIGEHDAAVGAFELTYSLYADELGTRDPKLIIPALNLAETHGRRGDFEASIDVAVAAKRLRNSRPESRVALDIAEARALVGLGEFERALSIYRSVFRDQHSAGNNRGLALVGMTECYLGLEEFERARVSAHRLDLWPGRLQVEVRARMHYALAQLALHDEDRAEARWHTRTALALFDEGTAEWPHDRHVVQNFAKAHTLTDE